MKKNIIPFLLFFLATFSFAQNKLRYLENVEKKENKVTIIVNDGEYHITYFTPEIVQTTVLHMTQTLILPEFFVPSQVSLPSNQSPLSGDPYT